MQNGMSCDELTGSCAFKAELKDKSPIQEKEQKMDIKKKEVEEPVTPVVTPVAEPVVEEKPVAAVTPVTTPEVVKPTEQAKQFDEKALVDAIVEANTRTAELKTAKEEEAAQRAIEEAANAAAEKKARIEASQAYIRDQAAKIIGIPDEEFDPDLAEEFYTLVSDAAEAIEAKVAGIIKPSQPE
jgi:multidrug efflux pump subunit AcrA (membrane-fusion protein)